ncbi:MAG: glucose-6-phosphate dehydrogenase [Planctomycetota bacterium]|nr:MAG: glucose-6-phosphate dehydrogenase [Planctomycetota bacterium]
MTSNLIVQAPEGITKYSDRLADPCIMVIFGASGDLTKRLLMPALFNLYCGGLLSSEFAIIGIAFDSLDTESFRKKMTEDIKKFNTRKVFDENQWNEFVQKLQYTQGDFSDPEAYKRLAVLINATEAKLKTEGNTLFYMATPPSVFELVSSNLQSSGVKNSEKGWVRAIFEKPFGHDLKTAVELNRLLLKHWKEEQIYRIDHYLGKETVQNILAFRFANGIFEPLWNKEHIDHIQFSVMETVGVESRGKYYETAGVLRDMIQNHMFQMLAYLCMEPPSSFKPDAIRNQKSELLDAVRIMTPEMVRTHTVRGQYGPGKKWDESPAPGYRQEADVSPTSNTETFACLKLFIDNWRWDGVPIYLRSGKNLWKRGTEIMVQFKNPPDILGRGQSASNARIPNRLFFHIQPDQGIELRVQGKSPGPTMSTQTINMRFDYSESFESSRGTGYEVLLYNCMIGDATLFSRTDLVETAWRIAQPIFDVWEKEPATDFPNYPAGGWGPKKTYDLIENDGRNWVEVVSRDVLEKIPLFKDTGKIFLYNLAINLRPDIYAPGDFIIKKGEVGTEMFIISSGSVEVLDDEGKIINTMGDGAFFGELSLLNATPRTATIRAASDCDIFILAKKDFDRVLKTYPEFLGKIKKIAEERYKVKLPTA